MGPSNRRILERWSNDRISIGGIRETIFKQSKRNKRTSHFWPNCDWVYQHEAPNQVANETKPPHAQNDQIQQGACASQHQARRTKTDAKHEGENQHQTRRIKTYTKREGENQHQTRTNFPDKRNRRHRGATNTNDKGKRNRRERATQKTKPQPTASPRPLQKALASMDWRGLPPTAGSSI